MPAPSSDHDRIDQEAAEWFVRRDAGLSDEEKASLDRWLAADPRHAERFAWHEATWDRFAGLHETDLDRIVHPTAEPLVDRRSRSFWRNTVVLGSLAASLVLGMFAWFVWPNGRDDAEPVRTAEFYANAYQNRILADGSIVELNEGAHLQVRLSPEERSVWLRAGEAHFDVVRDPSRPFVVYADGAAVRAVGTAFHVRITGQAIEVLVTEGRVHVSPVQPEPNNEIQRELGAQQRSVLPRSAGTAPTQIETLSETEVGEILAWKPATLEFSGAPLGDVVTAFNKRNDVQMIVDGEALARLPVELTFRSQNVEAFTRMLELTFDIRAERRGEREIVLSRAR